MATLLTRSPLSRLLSAPGAPCLSASWVMVTAGLGNEKWCELAYSDNRGQTFRNNGQWGTGRFRGMRTMLTFDWVVSWKGEHTDTQRRWGRRYQQRQESSAIGLGRAQLMLWVGD